VAGQVSSRKRGGQYENEVDGGGGDWVRRLIERKACSE
jgi:hypothetical protein